MICIKDGCQHESYEGDEYCALHCTKSTYSEDFDRPFLLRQFYNLLKEEIREKVLAVEAKYRVEEVESALIEDEPTNGFIGTLLGQVKFVFDSIKFPERNERDPFDYKKLLWNLGRIHFIRCTLNNESFSLPKTRVFFNNCIFNKEWWLKNYEQLKNVNGVLYQNCTFNNEVIIASMPNDELIINNDQFYNCRFQKIEIDNCTVNGLLFKEGITKEIEDNIRVRNSTFQDRFLLNGVLLSNFEIKNCEFNDKFEFKGSVVDGFTVIENTNFKEVTDFFGSSFNIFEMKKCIATSFVGFEDCKFEGEGGIQAFFKFITFENFINFRGAQFKSGVELSTINLRQNANFYNCEISYNKTSRESFRIVKNCLDKDGNHIAANKYYSFEMRKYREQIKGESGRYQDKFIYFLNEKISMFGQSYLRPILWVIVSVLVYMLLSNLHDSQFAYKNLGLGSWYNETAIFVNNFAKSILPFKKLLKPGMEFISLSFIGMYSVFVWHLVVAVKRHAKR